MVRQLKASKAMQDERSQNKYLWHPLYAGTLRGLAVGVTYGLGKWQQGEEYKYKRPDLFLAVADGVASALVGGSYVKNTLKWMQREGQEFDYNVRRTVSLELMNDGVFVHPDDITSTDIKQSKNPTIQREWQDFWKINMTRLGINSLATAGMMASPFVAEKTLEALLGGDKGEEKSPGIDLKNNPTANLVTGSAGALLTSNLIYGMEGNYWHHETWDIPKTGFYQLVKLREKTSRGVDVGFNDVYVVFQRMRTDGPALEGEGHFVGMIDEPEVKEMLRPAMDKICDYINEQKIYLPDLLHIFDRFNAEVPIEHDKISGKEALQNNLDMIIEQVTIARQVCKELATQEAKDTKIESRVVFDHYHDVREAKGAKIDPREVFNRYNHALEQAGLDPVPFNPEKQHAREALLRERGVRERTRDGLWAGKFASPKEKEFVNYVQQLKNEDGETLAGSPSQQVTQYVR